MKRIVLLALLALMFEGCLDTSTVEIDEEVSEEVSKNEVLEAIYLFKESLNGLGALNNGAMVGYGSIGLKFC